MLKIRLGSLLYSYGHLNQISSSQPRALPSKAQAPLARKHKANFSQRQFQNQNNQQQTHVSLTEIKALTTATTFGTEVP